MAGRTEQYEAIQCERLYEKIVDQIENRILSGELKLGEHLPSERELAEQFRVSRTAVREAVKTLSEKGLVQVRRGRGTFVTNGTSQAMRHSLGLMIKIGQAEGSRHLVEVREIFEPETAALAALRASDDQIAAMREAVATMDAALGDAETFIEGDLDFHLALAEASQNSVIPALIDSIVDLLREQRMAIFRVAGGPQRGQYHHQRILAAVTRHDPQGAREAMRAHLQQVREDTGASAEI
jgi:GntR family transcriptional regulator, transcriptional repressor for pyruvate dehydrogenase complex